MPYLFKENATGSQILNYTQFNRNKMEVVNPLGLWIKNWLK